MKETFETWLDAVDAVVQRAFSCGVDGLGDHPLRHWYEIGTPSTQAAAWAIERYFLNLFGRGCV